MGRLSARFGPNSPEVQEYETNLRTDLAKRVSNQSLQADKDLSVKALSDMKGHINESLSSFGGLSLGSPEFTQAHTSLLRMIDANKDRIPSGKLREIERDFLVKFEDLFYADMIVGEDYQLIKSVLDVWDNGSDEEKESLFKFTTSGSSIIRGLRAASKSGRQGAQAQALMAINNITLSLLADEILGEPTDIFLPTKNAKKVDESDLTAQFKRAIQSVPNINLINNDQVQQKLNLYLQNAEQKHIQGIIHRATGNYDSDEMQVIWEFGDAIDRNEQVFDHQSPDGINTLSLSIKRLISTDEAIAARKLKLETTEAGRQVTSDLNNLSRAINDYRNFLIEDIGEGNQSYSGYSGSGYPDSLGGKVHFGDTNPVHRNIDSLDIQLGTLIASGDLPHSQLEKVKNLQIELNAMRDFDIHWKDTRNQSTIADIKASENHFNNSASTSVSLSKFSPAFKKAVAEKIEQTEQAVILAGPTFGANTEKTVKLVREKRLKDLSLVTAFLNMVNQQRRSDASHSLANDADFDSFADVILDYFTNEKEATPNGFIHKYLFDSQQVDPKDPASWSMGLGWDFEKYFHLLGGKWSPETIKQLMLHAESTENSSLVYLATEALSDIKKIDPRFGISSLGDVASKIDKFNKLKSITGLSKNKIAESLMRDNKTTPQELEASNKQWENDGLLNKEVDNIVKDFLTPFFGIVRGLDSLVDRTGLDIGIPFYDFPTQFQGQVPLQGELGGGEDSIKEVRRFVRLWLETHGEGVRTQPVLDNLKASLSENFGLTKLSGVARIMFKPPEHFTDVPVHIVSDYEGTEVLRQRGLSIEEAFERNIAETIPSPSSVLGNIGNIGVNKDTGKPLIRFKDGVLRKKFVKVKDGNPVYKLVFVENGDPTARGEDLGLFMFDLKALDHSNDGDPKPTEVALKAATGLAESLVRGAIGYFSPMHRLPYFGSDGIPAPPPKHLTGAFGTGQVRAPVVRRSLTIPFNEDAWLIKHRSDSNDGSAVSKPQEVVRPKDKFIDSPHAKELFSYFNKIRRGLPGRNNPFNMKFTDRLGNPSPSSAREFNGVTSIDKNGFAHFNNLQNGIRAGLYNLRYNYLLDGNDTVRKIINKYSPESDDNDTVKLISEMSDYMGVGPDEQLKIDDENIDNTLRKLQFAIFIQEGTGVGVGGARTGQEFIQKIYGDGANNLWRLLLDTAMYDSRLSGDNQDWEGSDK